MTYWDQHLAKLRDVGDFDEIETRKNEFGDNVDAVCGIIGNKTYLQSIRFDSSGFTAGEARSWLRRYGWRPVSFRTADKEILAMTKQISKQSPNMNFLKDYGDFDGMKAELVGTESELQFASSIAKSGGIEIQKFVKDMIAVGTYIHPKHKWKIPVTEEKIDGWIASFNAMKANGVDVEVVVDHRTDAESVRGYLVDMFRKGDTLFGVHEMRGKKSIELARTVKNISVMIDKNYVDGKGKEYGEAIVHSSIVQQPVVPGQEEFIQIAASRDSAVESIPLFVEYSRIQGDCAMLNFEKIAKLLNVEKVDEDTLEESLEGFIQKMSLDKAESDKKLSVVEQEVVKLKESIGNKVETKIDKNLAEQMGVTAETQLSNLVTAGKLTPKAAEKIRELFIGTSGQRNLQCLSIGDSGEKSILQSVVDVLNENDPVVLGQMTQKQIMGFSRVTPGKEEADDGSTTKEMLSMINPE